MNASTPHESYNLNIHTPAGDLTASVSVPTGLIPITDIIPLMRSLGDKPTNKPSTRRFNQAPPFPVKRDVPPAVA